MPTLSDFRTRFARDAEPDRDPACPTCGHLATEHAGVDCIVKGCCCPIDPDATCGRCYHLRKDHATDDMAAACRIETGYTASEGNGLNSLFCDCAGFVPFVPPSPESVRAMLNPDKEKAKSKPAEMCSCGHPDEDHSDEGSGECHHYDAEGLVAICPCDDFNPSR